VSGRGECVCEVIGAPWILRLIHRVVSLARMLRTLDHVEVGAKSLERSLAKTELVLVVLLILNPEPEKKRVGTARVVWY
jgi:hypothetical protein